MALVRRQAQQLPPGLCPCDRLHRSLPRVAERHARTSATRTGVAPAGHEAVWPRLRSLLTSAVKAVSDASPDHVTPPRVVSALYKTQAVANNAAKGGCAGARVSWPRARSGEQVRAAQAAPPAPSGAPGAGRTALSAPAVGRMQTACVCGARAWQRVCARAAAVSGARVLVATFGRAAGAARHHLVFQTGCPRLRGLGLREEGVDVELLACVRRWTGLRHTVLGTQWPT